MSFTTIIYAHPYDQSFNHGILRRVQQLLDEKGLFRPTVAAHAAKCRD